MKLSSFTRSILAFVLLSGLVAGLTISRALGQSRRQPPTSTQKKNKRPAQTTQPAEKADEPPPPDLIGKPQDAEKLSISTQIVNVDAVVYHKKSGQIITGLKKENFALFSDGVKQQITNFSTPEAPITAALVVEYSKLGEDMGYYGSGGYDPGKYEVVRPVAMFLSQFIKPPDDYVTVVAFRHATHTSDRLYQRSAAHQSGNQSAACGTLRHFVRPISLTH